MIEKLIRRITVDNSHFTWLLTLIIFLFGTTALYRIPISQDPDIDFPSLELFLYLDGASPTDIQQNVIFPIETEIRTMDGVDKVFTTIEHNLGYMHLKLNYGEANVEKARELESLINSIRRKLPDALEYSVRPATISEFTSAFILALSSPQLGPQARDEIVLDLITDLERIPHLKNIELVRSEEEIVIDLDIVAMRHRGIGVDQVIDAVRSDNRFAVSGRVRINDKYLRISGPGKRYDSMDDIANTSVFTEGGNAVHLDTIARIHRRAKGNRIATRYNGYDVALVKVSVNKNVNIIDTKNNISKRISAFKNGISNEVNIEFVFDQSEGVHHLIYNLLLSFLQGLCILFLVLLFSVGYRSTLIISSILPLSILTALMLFSFTNYGIQQVSIVGFIVAIGLIVDNAIVVTENAYLLQRYRGLSREDAAVIGTHQAVSPLLSSTLTTMLAFLPVFLLATDIGIYLRSMTISIWLSLFASLFLAVTFVTLLLARYGTIGPFFGLPNPPSILIGMINFRDKFYTTLLRWVMRRRIFSIILFLLTLIWALVTAAHMQKQLYPHTGEPYFTINVIFPPGSDEQIAKRLAQSIESKLKEMPDIDSYSVVSGSDYPQVNMNMNYLGDLVFLVKTGAASEKQQTQIVEKLKRAVNPLRAYADLSFSLFKYKDKQYPSPFNLTLSSSDIEIAKRYAKDLHDPLREVPGVDTINNPVRSSQLNLQFKYDENRARTLGVEKSKIDRLVSMLTYGFEIDRFMDHRGTEFPVLLNIAPSTDDPLSSFNNVQVSAIDGAEAPLNEVINVSLEEGESRIRHIQYRPTIEIDFWIDSGYDAQTVANNVMQVVKNREKPDGLTIEIGGALKKEQQEFANLGRNGLLAAVLIFSVFVLQFRSFMQPLIIFSAVPFCVIGAVLGLVVGGFPITFFAAIGITSLMGIVVNDSILLVSEGNHLQQKDSMKSVNEIAIEAARKRFMPVILTSITTIAGLLPMALTETVFRTMAVTIVGGMVTSSLLVLLLVPTLYSIVLEKTAS